MTYDLPERVERTKVRDLRTMARFVDAATKRYGTTTATDPLYFHLSHFKDEEIRSIHHFRDIFDFATVNPKGIERTTTVLYDGEMVLRREPVPHEGFSGTSHGLLTRTYPITIYRPGDWEEPLLESARHRRRSFKDMRHLSEMLVAAPSR